MTEPLTDLQIIGMTLIAVGLLCAGWWSLIPRRPRVGGLPESHPTSSLSTSGASVVGASDFSEVKQ